MDICSVLGCSPPSYRRVRSFRARAHDAEVVVFATVIDSPAEAKKPLYAYYSAKLSLHCILKGPQLPRIITVHRFGNDGGACTRTDAIPHRSYIFLLKKVYGQYRPHNVGIAPASKRAREKLLLRFLPDFWSTSHRPYKRRPLKTRAMHCPTLKKMKRILRKSMRKYIQSRPILWKKKLQLREWLKKLRSNRKAAKAGMAFVYKNVSAPLNLNISDQHYRVRMAYNNSKLSSFKRGRGSLVKRSIAKETIYNTHSLANCASPTSPISSAIYLITFVWCMCWRLWMQAVHDWKLLVNRSELFSTNARSFEGKDEPWRLPGTAVPMEGSTQDFQG